MEQSDRPYHDRVADEVGKEPEDMFELYLEQLGLVKNQTWMKTGTSPWEHTMPLFWFYTFIVINPDYLVYIQNELRLCEVKGTTKLKLDDYQKLYQMYQKAKEFKQVDVGIYYYNSHYKAFKWIPFVEIQRMWKDMEHWGTYPEKDFQGNPKLFKQLPFNRL
jgi:hypothetical protein